MQTTDRQAIVTGYHFGVDLFCINLYSLYGIKRIEIDLMLNHVPNFPPVHLEIAGIDAGINLGISYAVALCSMAAVEERIVNSEQAVRISDEVVSDVIPLLTASKDVIEETEARMYRILAILFPDRKERYMNRYIHI